MAFDETPDTELIELGIFLRVSMPFIGSNEDWRLSLDTDFSAKIAEECSE